MSVTRRSFLKGAAGAFGAAALGSAALATGCSSPAPQSAESGSNPDAQAPTQAAAAEETYTASAKGCHGDVTVSMTLKDGAIAELTATGPLETPNVGGIALALIPDAIVKANGLTVDAASGATMTSTAIIKAAAFCLTQAGVPVSIAPEAQSYKAGTYSAEYKGHMGPVPVEVTFSDSAITKIDLGENTETPSLVGGAYDNIATQVIDQQTLAVDAVTSATYSSRAILQGIEDCVVQAGGDPAKLKHPVLDNPSPAADEELSADVVVVGGGTSGSIALYRLATAGLKAVCLESTPVVGGMGEIAGFMTMRWYGSDAQKRELGLSDEDVAAIAAADVNDLVKAVGYEVDARMLNRIATECGPMVDMLEESGMELKVDSERGIKIPAKGTRWQALHEKAAQLGAQTLRNHRVDELLTEGGAVTGVVATRPDGSHLTVHAKAVILCSGGASANHEMMLQYFPDYVDTVQNCSISSVDGAALQAAWDAGAAKGMFGVHAHNHTLPLDAKYAGISTVEATNPLSSLGNTPLLWLDREGRRFANEERCYSPTPGGNAILFAKRAFNVLDQATVDTLEANGSPIRPWRGIKVDTPLEGLSKELEEGESNGYVFSADTIEELAKKTGWDPAVAQEEIARYNEAVRAQSDPDYQKAPENLLFEITQPPFYAVELRPRCLGSFGGLLITKNYGVFDENGKPIEGLYAAGDMATGWFGKVYPDVNGLTSFHNTTSGFVAANSVIEKLA